MNGNLQIAYEDEHIIICNKPAGLASQSERSLYPDLNGMVYTYLVKKGVKKEPHIINRLDKPVGGLVLFALDSKTAAALSAFSGSHSIEKCYYAIVKGEVEESGRYTDYLVKNNTSNFSKIGSADDEDAKKAVLDYERLETKMLGNELYSLVRVKLHTGRHHQIRVQMAGHNHPIYGDVKYNQDFFGQRQVVPQLFAYRLSFNNPWGAERITVEVAPEGKFTEFAYFK